MEVKSSIKINNNYFSILKTVKIMKMRVERCF